MDKEIVLTALSKGLDYLPPELANDMEFIEKAVQTNGLILQYVSHDIQEKQKEITKTAVKQCGLAIQYAPLSMRENKSLALIAVENNGQALQFLSEDLRNDEEICMKAVRNDGDALQFCSSILQNRKDIVMTAVTSTPKVLRYCPEEFRNDYEVVLQAVKVDGMLLEYASQELQNNSDIVHAAAKSNGYSLKYVTKEEVKCDREILMDAAASNRFTLTLIPSSCTFYKYDREFMLYVVTRNGLVLEYATPDLQDDFEIALAAVKESVHAFEYVSKRLKGDREFIWHAVSMTRSIAFCGASEDLRKDKELVLQAVKFNGNALQYALNDLRNDFEVVLESVKEFGFALRFASPEMRNNKQIVLEAVKRTGEALQYASKSLRHDKEIILEALKETRKAVNFIPHSLLSNLHDYLQECSVDHESRISLEVQKLT
nr:unnamed protein product [Naegleria fowleri]